MKCLPYYISVHCDILNDVTVGKNGILNYLSLSLFLKESSKKKKIIRNRETGHIQVNILFPLLQQQISIPVVKMSDLLERFSYDLEMCTCEQNANNRLNEQRSSRWITQMHAGFDWSCEHAIFSSELKVIF